MIEVIVIFMTFQAPPAPSPPPKDLASLLKLPPKANKLASVKKPEGIDPNIILAEREHRYAEREFLLFFHQK